MYFIQNKDENEDFLEKINYLREKIMILKKMYFKNDFTHKNMNFSQNLYLNIDLFVLF